MTAPYLLRMEPLFQDYLWGGRNLETKLGKPLPPGGVWAESWEAIDHPEHQSRISNGDFEGETLHDVSVSDATWLFGDQVDHPTRLPLLFKYLDCQRVLSVQVHPNDEYGSQMTPPDLGKTEAWYIVAAETGAKLYAGLKAGVTPDRLSQAIEQETLEDCLHVIQPSPGDCVFIPAGTVHALGAGLLVAEIQQASNTTFRLYDWKRVGADGKPRPLHVAQALEVIDFEAGPRSIQEPKSTEQAGRQRLVECDKFIFDRLQSDAPLSVAGDGRFHLLSSPTGGVVLQLPNHAQPESLEIGETVMVPACMPSIEIRTEANAVLLDMYLPKSLIAE